MRPLIHTTTYRGSLRRHAILLGVYYNTHNKNGTGKERKRRRWKKRSKAIPPLCSFPLLRLLSPSAPRLLLINKHEGPKESNKEKRAARPHARAHTHNRFLLSSSTPLSQQPLPPHLSPAPASGPLSQSGKKTGKRGVVVQRRGWSVTRAVAGPPLLWSWCRHYTHSYCLLSCFRCRCRCHPPPSTAAPRVHVCTWGALTPRSPPFL